MKNLANIENASPAATRDARSRLGQQLVAIGRIQEREIPRIISMQKERNLLFGEAAIALGILSEKDVKQALSQQFAYPYLDVAGSAISPQLAIAHKPFGREAEAIRALRSQLSLRWFDDKRKAIAITSARSGDGSSILAANLAVSFAQLGENTLLIDANLRRPVHHELFALDNSVGLSNVLMGRYEANDGMSEVPPFKNLTVMCAGPSPPNPQELLGLLAFSYLIESAPAGTNGYDFVIIDTPPILEYADAQLVAAAAGGCILSTRRNVTRVADINVAKNLVSPTGAELVGVVINN